MPTCAARCCWCGSTIPASSTPRVFNGSALTYFGRWTYKIEEAARAGAAAILLIHTTPSAGYDWQVVKNSWSGEELYLPASLENDLKFRGWISETSLRSLLAARKIDLERLYRQSLSRKFRPVNLGFKARISGRNAFRTLEARNVIAEIPGRSGKSIVLSAHIDHLGRDETPAGRYDIQRRHRQRLGRGRPGHGGQDLCRVRRANCAMA